jgi:hypothetical protein
MALYVGVEGRKYCSTDVRRGLCDVHVIGGTRALDGRAELSYTLEFCEKVTM